MSQSELKLGVFAGHAGTFVTSRDRRSNSSTGPLCNFSSLQPLSAHPGKRVSSAMAIFFFNSVRSKLFTT